MNKNIKRILTLILALVVAMSFNFASFAQEVIPGANGTHGVIIPMAAICDYCNEGVLLPHTTYTPWLYQGFTRCTTHIDCVVKTYSREVTTTYKCNNCGRGFSTTYTDYKTEHVHI